MKKESKQCATAKNHNTDFASESSARALLGRTIKVSKKHIREGLKLSLNDCPICLAIKEVLPGASVLVDLDTSIVNGVLFQTPESVRTFLDRFDYTKNRESINGFCFTLDGFGGNESNMGTRG